MIGKETIQSANSYRLLKSVSYQSDQHSAVQTQLLLSICGH